jgi:hypothetical protein
MNFIHKVPLAPSKCLSKWIKVDKWDYFQNRQQVFIFSLFSFNFYLFFEYETFVRSSALSLSHSDPDPSSVLGLQPRISKVFSRSLEQFFLKAVQNNFGNKIPFRMVAPHMHPQI